MTFKRLLVALGLLAGLVCLTGATVPAVFPPVALPATTGSMILYVNGGNGSDSYLCNTPQRACKTFAGADRLVPYRVRHDVQFWMAKGAYNEMLRINHVIEPGGSIEVNGFALTVAAEADASVSFVLDAGGAVNDAGGYDGGGSATFLNQGATATFPGPVSFTGSTTGNVTNLKVGYDGGGTAVVSGTLSVTGAATLTGGITGGATTHAVTAALPDGGPCTLTFNVAGVLTSTTCY